MLRKTWKSIVAASLLAVACTGCSSLPTSTVRGQSPDEAAQFAVHQEEGWKASSSQIQQTGGVQRTDLPMHGEVKGVIKNELNEYHVTRHGYKTPVGPGTQAPGGNMGYSGNYDPYANWGSFNQYPCPTGPAGFSNPPAHYQEQGWDHGGMRHRGQYHYHTYKYKAPNCLTYPAPNQPAGAVTYPYYTHKGPSDFFMK